MKTLKYILLSALISACGTSEPDPVPERPQPAAAAVVTPQDCAAVTSLEVVHTVSGAPVTTKVRIDPDASADPVKALTAFQRIANFYGKANIVRTRQIAEVQCFPATTPPDPDGLGPAQLRMKALAAFVPGGADVCASDSVNPHDCPATAPANQYEYNDGSGSCSVTNLGEAVSFGCDDSGLIVSSRGDAVVTINSANVRAEILERTKALRRLLGDANVLTNLHFDVVISPDTQAALVDNAAYNSIAAQLAAAAQNHQPLPDIQQLLAQLPNQPTNVAFKEQLEKAYKTRQERLDLLSAITNGSHLSNAQVNAFYQQFVGKSQQIDKLLIQNTPAALKAIATSINDTITQLANTSPTSTIFEQVKSGARALLESQTTCGLFDPEQVIDFVPQTLYSQLTDADIEKRQLAEEMFIDLNESLRKGDGGKMAMATFPIIGLLAAAADDDDMDKAWRLYDQVKATEFFVENTDPRGTRFDVHLSPGAQTMFSISVSPTSAAAYDVIVVLNEAASYNAQTGKVTVDYQAIISLNARQALATNDAIRALYHTEEAAGALDVAKGFVHGVLAEYGDMASGIFHMATHPFETYDGLKAAVVNWDKTLAMVWSQGAAAIHRWPNMTAQEKADFMGHLAAQILLELPNEARQAGRIEEAARDAAKLHLDKANYGLRIIERTGVALGPEAASELARRMEKLGITVVDDAAALADKLDDYLPCALAGGAGLRGASVNSVKPPCNAYQISQLMEQLALESRAIGLKGAQLEDGIVAVAKSGLTPIAPSHWRSSAGLIYGADAEYGNRVQHVLHHAADDLARAEHGVFDAGRRGALSAVDEAWQRVKFTDGSSDVKIIEQGARTRYEVNMHRRVGFVGGTQGAAAGHPATNYVVIVVQNDNEIITSFPWKGP